MVVSCINHGRTHACALTHINLAVCVAVSHGKFQVWRYEAVCGIMELTGLSRHEMS